MCDQHDRRATASVWSGGIRCIGYRLLATRYWYVCVLCVVTDEVLDWGNE